MKLLPLSLQGGGMILCVLLLRSFFQRRLPRTTFWILWIAAAVRLMLPFSIPLPILRHGTPALSDLSPLLSQTAWSPAGALSGSAENPAEMLSTGGLSIWHVLWAAGAVLLLGYFMVSYLRYLRIFRASVPDDTSEIQVWLDAHRPQRSITVRWCVEIASPLTYGIFRPVILLPATMDRQDFATLQLVLTHEWVHIRRFDALTKLLFAAALTVHWFNPLVWVLFVLGNRDLELSCDAWVLRHIGREYRASYALTLLNLEERRSFPCCNQFSGHFFEERIKSIMQYKRHSAPVLILVFLVVLIVASVFVVQPVTSANIQIQGVSGTEENTEADNSSADGADAYEIAIQWAEALKDRNAARRYSLLADDSKPADYEEFAAGVGISSPWVTDYDVTLDGTTAVITYRTETSEPETYIYQEVLELGEEDGQTVVRAYYVTVNYLRKDLHEEAQEIQKQVLEGHLTWRLDPESVALGFAHETLGLSDLETVSASDQEVIFRTAAGETISVELYRPLRVEHGFLAVYGYSIGSNHTILDNVAIY